MERHSSQFVISSSFFFPAARFFPAAIPFTAEGPTRLRLNHHRSFLECFFSSSSIHPPPPPPLSSSLLKYIHRSRCQPRHSGGAEPPGAFVFAAPPLLCARNSVREFRTHRTVSHPDFPNPATHSPGKWCSWRCSLLALETQHSCVCLRPG